MDGKAVCGAVQPDGRAVHLLAAMAHEVHAVLAQRDVAHKTNEITQLKPLLDPLELTGWAVTLDALHAQRETARCTYANICEHCPSFHAEPSSLPILAAQRLDAEALARDAEQRGWITEAERHQRLITQLDTLINQAQAR